MSHKKFKLGDWVRVKEGCNLRNEPPFTGQIIEISKFPEDPSILVGFHPGPDGKYLGKFWCYSDPERGIKLNVVLLKRGKLKKQNL